jgi:hypothetical protein
MIPRGGTGRLVLVRLRRIGVDRGKLKPSVHQYLQVLHNHGAMVSVGHTYLMV